MKSRVEWTRRAKDELALLWLSAADRNSVTQSAREIEDALKYNGMNAGESRFGNLRILFVSTLGCYFHYREAEQTAVVVKIWQPKRNSN